MSEDEEEENNGGPRRGGITKKVGKGSCTLVEGREAGQQVRSCEHRGDREGSWKKWGINKLDTSSEEGGRRWRVGKVLERALEQDSDTQSKNHFGRSSWK